MSGVTRRRVARKAHRCGCGNLITPGDVYLSHVEFPGDLHDGPGPWRLDECARCAHRYGRDTDLDPVPYDQCCREGLL